MSEPTKICTKCGERLPESAYYRRASGPRAGALMTPCRRCMSGSPTFGASTGGCRHCARPYRRVPLGAIPQCACWPVALTADEHGSIVAVSR